jgi:hypothetical protein
MFNWRAKLGRARLTVGVPSRAAATARPVSSPDPRPRVRRKEDDRSPVEKWIEPSEVLVFMMDVFVLG